MGNTEQRSNCNSSSCSSSNSSSNNFGNGSSSNITRYVDHQITNKELSYMEKENIER